jgi:hypothetical protein
MFTESIAHLDQSRSPRKPSSSRTKRCRLAHTLAFVHSVNRRWSNQGAPMLRVPPAAPHPVGRGTARRAGRVAGPSAGTRRHVTAQHARHAGRFAGVARLGPCLPRPRVGEAALTVPRPVSAGHTVEAAEEFAARVPAYRDADPAAVTLFARTLYAAWEQWERTRPMPHRAELTAAARAWAEHRTT